MISSVTVTPRRISGGIIKKTSQKRGRRKPAPNPLKEILEYVKISRKLMCLDLGVSPCISNANLHKLLTELERERFKNAISNEPQLRTNPIR